jgi:hypothetical protein
MTDDLVERLRDADRNSVQRMNGSRIFEEAADAILGLQDRVDELEANGEAVAAEFEKDCWVAMRSLLDLCNFNWRDIDQGDGVTADDAREYIATTIREMEASEATYRTRLEAAEAEVARMREARTEIAALVPEDAEPCDDALQQAQFRNAIEQSLHLIDAALQPGERT